MSGLAASSRLEHHARLLVTAIRYELTKASVFRVGFLVREVFRGLLRPLVMIFLFESIFAAQPGVTLGGLDRRATIQYLLLLALCEKLVFHDRGLDLAEQIFQGYVTKFLVMPFSYFVLPLARFVQFTLVQAVIVSAFFGLGALCVPEFWPRPVSTLALVQALVLVLLGSYAFLLWYFTLSCLAFWLDVVWTLFVMSRFVVLFVAGAVLPIALFPDGLRASLAWLFPYWTIAAPIEIYAGRMHSADFGRGVLVIGVSIASLEVLRRAVWKRGSQRYAGSGM